MMERRILTPRNGGGGLVTPELRPVPQEFLNEHIIYLRENNKLLTELQEILRGRLRPLVTPQQVEQDLKAGSRRDYQVKSFGLGSARVNEEVRVEGDSITAWTDGSMTSGFTVRLNTTDNDAIPLVGFNPHRAQFYRLFLTTPAQAGKTLWLHIGGESISTYGPQTVTASLSASFENQVSGVLVSSTANILAGATWTSAAFDVEKYGVVLVSVFMDQPGTVLIDQSLDLANYDIVESAAYAASATPGFFTNVYATQARVRVTNTGGVDTTACRIYVRARRI